MNRCNKLVSQLALLLLFFVWPLYVAGMDEEEGMDKKGCLSQSVFVKKSIHVETTRTSVDSAAAIRDIDLLLLAGQSNSVGRATPMVFDGIAFPGTSPLDARVRYYYDVDNIDGAYPANSGQTFGPLATYYNAAAKREEFGHEFSVSRRLVETGGKDLAVIKFAVGGARIDRWLPGAIDYTGFIGAVTDGIDELVTIGVNVNIVGLVWLQGESSGNAEFASRYETHLDEFIAGVRKELTINFPFLGFESLPVVLVEPAHIRGASAYAVSNLNMVDAAMMRFAAADSNSIFVPTADIDGYVDVVHFNAASQHIIGERIADVLNSFR